MRVEAPEGTILRNWIELAVRVEQVKRAFCGSLGCARLPWMQRRLRDRKVSDDVSGITLEVTDDEAFAVQWRVKGEYRR